MLCIVGTTILACLVHFRLVCKLLGNMSSTSDIQLLTQQFAYSKFSHIDLDEYHKNYLSIIKKWSNCVFIFFWSYVGRKHQVRLEFQDQRLRTETLWSIPGPPPTRTLNMLFNPPEFQFPHL